jgi:hypothetical protein
VAIVRLQKGQRFKKELKISQVKYLKSNPASRVSRGKSTDLPMFSDEKCR